MPTDDKKNKKKSSLSDIIKKLTIGLKDDSEIMKRKRKYEDAGVKGHGGRKLTVK